MIATSMYLLVASDMYLGMELELRYLANPSAQLQIHDWIWFSFMTHRARGDSRGHAIFHVKLCEVGRNDSI